MRFLENEKKIHKINEWENEITLILKMVFVMESSFGLSWVLLSFKKLNVKNKDTCSMMFFLEVPGDFDQEDILQLNWMFSEL